MKKTGIILLIAGLLTMGYAGVKFIMQKKQGSEERMEGTPLSFPWLPLTGAALTAGGIILMGRGRNRKGIK